MGRLRRVGTVLLVLTLLAAGGAACGDDEDDASGPTITSEAPDSVEVTAVDFGYEGVPTSVSAGTQLTLTNTSTREIHELVAVLLPDDDQRSAEEISKLPEAELGALFTGEPATVLVAPPDGAEMIPAVGDGSLNEAGRYVLLCFIPVGADPQEYLEAAEESEGGPPEVGGGPPHFTQGMYAEITVE